MTTELAGKFITPEEARLCFDLQVRETEFATPTNRQLEANGIARIAMPLVDADFEELTAAYEDCITAYPHELAATSFIVDRLFGSEAGNRRKELKIDAQSGLQVADPKNFMHFTEGSAERWTEQFAVAPKAFRNFLSIGHSIHQELVKIARIQLAALEATHPNITRAHFPGTSAEPNGRTFMRLLSYDGYTPEEGMGAVAKPHFDIGGLTIQAYADASGFWAAPDGVSGARTLHDTQDNEAYLFAGIGHQKLYGKSDKIKPLWHGVDRVVANPAKYVPKRHTIVMFIDIPGVDYDVTTADTQPIAAAAIERTA